MWPDEIIEELETEIKRLHDVIIHASQAVDFDEIARDDLSRYLSDEIDSWEEKELKCEK